MSHPVTEKEIRPYARREESTTGHREGSEATRHGYSCSNARKHGKFSSGALRRIVGERGRKVLNLRAGLGKWGGKRVRGGKRSKKERGMWVCAFPGDEGSLDRRDVLSG